LGYSSGGFAQAKIRKETQMQLLKKSLFASFVVQSVLLGIVVGSSLMGTEQNAFLWIFPFVAGVQIGPLLMQLFLGMLSPPVMLKLAIAAAVVSNFTVYAALFYTWFTLREQLSTRKHQPVTA
jgi:hypothetical protein